MKLTLTLEAKTLRVSYWGRILAHGCLGIGLLLATGGLLYLASKSETLICNRVEPTQISCDWFLGYFLNQKQSTQTLYYLDQIVLEAERTTDGSAYRIALLNPDGKPDILTRPNNNYQEVQRHIEELHLFLADTHQSQLIITHRPYGHEAGWMMAIWGFMGGLLLGSVVLSPIWVEVHVDSPQGWVTVNRRFLARTVHNQFTASQILKATIDPPVKQEEALYRVRLTLKSGEAIWLGFFGSSYEQASALVSALESLLMEG